MPFPYKTRRPFTLMTSIQLFWLLLGTTWTAIEIAIAIKTRVRFTSAGALEYRSERLIWMVVAVALAASLWIKQLHLATLPIEAFNRQVIAIVIFIGSLALRCSAVLSLGQFFSTTVITQESHRLIDSGPYRFIRHPAYTGLLTAFLAAGIAMGDGLALLILLGPVGYVLMQRMRIEERWLSEHFGKDYDDYCRRTGKLIPWLY